MEQQQEWIDLERRSGTYQFGHREGLEQGLEQGRHALVTLLFEVLQERGLAVDAGHEARLRGCEDIDQIRRWVRQAMHVASVEALEVD